MSAAPDPLGGFRQLLQTATQDPSERPLLFTDGLLGPRLGALLRRCAVPHEFDRDLLMAISGSDEASTDAVYGQFSELSVIQFTGSALSVHERWRKPLWAWWLAEPQRGEFTQLSALLAGWFEARASSATPEINLRRRMFHLIGANHDQGMALFDRLYFQARHGRRFSECSLLIRLVREYDPLLGDGDRALLAYQEGKLASDLLEWEPALVHFRAVREGVASDALRISALIREGHVLRALGRNDAALALLEQARKQIAASPATAHLSWRALQELGEVYRDIGQGDRARATLTAARDAAAGDGADMAGILNSLGTVQLRLLDTPAAVLSFRRSLALLERGGDVVRPGGVLNNLGLAQVEQCDWAGAEASFSASLACKRAASDQSGQGTALLNLSRVQVAQDKVDAACTSAREAARLFEAAGDGRGLARALLARARLASRAKQAAEAVDLARQAVDRATLVGDLGLAATAREELARLPRAGPWPVMLKLVAIGLLVALVIAIIAIIDKF